MFAGVGERTREGNDLYKEMIEGVSLFLPYLTEFNCKLSRTYSNLRSAECTLAAQ